MRIAVLGMGTMVATPLSADTNGLMECQGPGRSYTVHNRTLDQRGTDRDTRYGAAAASGGLQAAAGVPIARELPHRDSAET